jgi:hypothetical protein
MKGVPNSRKPAARSAPVIDERDDERLLARVVRRRSGIAPSSVRNDPGSAAPSRVLKGVDARLRGLWTRVSAPYGFALHRAGDTKPAILLNHSVRRGPAAECARQSLKKR